MRIAIVEDEEACRQQLLAYIHRYFLERPPIEVNTFLSAEAFLSAYTGKEDVVFMDIRLPGMDGMEATRLLHQKNPSLLVIFTTSLAQYAAKGYSVNAFDFLLKPVNYYDFSLKMDRAVEKLRASHAKTLCLKNKAEVTYIRAEDILYVEVLKHRAVFHTIRGDYEEYRPLYKIQDELSGLPFSLCNQCFLVHLRYVTRINSESVFLGKIELQISHSKKKTFLRDLNLYYANGGIQSCTN